MSSRLVAAGFVAFAALISPAEAAARKTVCTITVNSPDEKETFRSRLPKGDYEFVELVEKGRPDWLRSSCQKQVQCDVLVVSGHFNAGDTFYSDQLDRDEYLEIDELERASCSASCPGLFSRLKEVYLFGCESLDPQPSLNGTGESGRERMRRIFAGVPVIYGFSGSAPVGPTAAMLLNRYFDTAPGAEIGSGRVNARLLQVFARNSMVRTEGVRAGEPLAKERRQVCRFFDEREAAAAKLAFVHALLRGDEGDTRTHFSRVEKLFASFTPEEHASPAFQAALARISADDAARERYLAELRRAPSALRARMVSLGGTLGWLSPEQQRDERVALVNAMLAQPALTFAEVDLACTLNADGGLVPVRDQLVLPASRVGRAAHEGVMACMGSPAGRAQMLRALLTGDANDIQVARAYLRHRPVSEGEELRRVAQEITRMSGPPQAQARAYDALARLHIADREILDDLTRAFAQARSPQVQQAIAEVFMRSDPDALPRQDLLAVLREHRVRVGRGSDLVDALITRLQ